MRKILSTTVLLLPLALGLGAAHAAAFNFSGSTDSGPLVGMPFSGSFSYNDSNLPADGDALLSAFTLGFAGQSYTLASAVGQPAAVFAGGSFIGLSYLDDASPDAAVRPRVALVPGAFGIADAYLAYEGASGLGGFGSYAVSAVPEPASAWLLLGGLVAGSLMWPERRRRRAP